ncbi:hypothetical protein CRYUN_Cryun11dG0110300 [Craigia yunnanensis]
MSKMEALKITLILLLLTNLRSITSSPYNHRYNTSLYLSTKWVPSTIPEVKGQILLEMLISLSYYHVLLILIFSPKLFFCIAVRPTNTMNYHSAIQVSSLPIFEHVEFGVVTSSVLNVVAVSYGATAALPLSTIMAIILIYTFLTILLLALGGVIGYLFRSEFYAPCATKRYPREIPPLAWYRKTPCQMFLDDLCCGGSAAIFMFAYSIYFYTRSSMSGLLQLSFVIGYNACMCYAFFLMLGTIGFHSSLMFVCYIYRAVKSE